MTRAEITQYSPKRESLALSSELKNSAYRVRDFIRQVNPDITAFIGRSTIVSQTIVRECGIITPGTKLIDFPYSSLSYAEVNKELVTLLQNHVQDLNHSKSIAVIDEFVASGAKAEILMRILKWIGYTDVSFAVFSGTKPVHNVFVGSYDRQLDYFMRRVARDASFARGKLQDQNQPLHPSTRAMYVRDLDLLTRHIATQVRE